MALLGSRTDISSDLHVRAFRKRLSELSSKVHEPFGRGKASRYRGDSKDGRVSCAAVVCGVANRRGQSNSPRLPSSAVTTYTFTPPQVADDPSPDPGDRQRQDETDRPWRSAPRTKLPGIVPTEAASKNRARSLLLPDKATPKCTSASTRPAQSGVARDNCASTVRFSASNGFHLECRIAKVHFQAARATLRRVCESFDISPA